MPRLFLDIETRSSVDLKRSNVYRYSESPDFEILMCAWSTDGVTVSIAVGEEEIEAIPGLFDPAVVKVAHNASFERVCLSVLAGLPPGQYLAPEQFLDTAMWAAQAALPRKLEKLAPALGAEEKDTAGTRLINLFSKPHRGRFTTPSEKPEQWEEFKAYCIQDVRTLIACFVRLPEPPLSETLLFNVAERVNDRGMLADLDLARAAVIAGQENAATHRAEMIELTGVENPGSVQQLAAWFSATGLEMPDFRAETVEAMLLDPWLRPHHRRALELRQELALTALKKFDAALANACEDNRLRGAFNFFGAHTGRWSGRGAQPQNLPRAVLRAIKQDIEALEKRTGRKVTDAEEARIYASRVEAAVSDLLNGFGASSHTLKALVRSMFLGPLTVVDYSAIEARVLAWLTGEQWVLDAFLAKRDLYLETAARMNLAGQRQKGKVADLACGYGGSVAALRRMGAEGTDEELQVLVNSWREVHPLTVRFWRDLDRAFWSGGRVGRLVVEREGTTRRIVLPSGRKITYRKVARKQVTRARKDGTTYTTHQLTYQGQFTREYTWGGSLAENVTQAVARDVWATGLVNLDAAGFPVVGHVHDEAIIDGLHPVEEVSELMCAVGPWAEGLPLAAEGFSTPRYRKG